MINYWVRSAQRRGFSEIPITFSNLKAIARQLDLPEGSCQAIDRDDRTDGSRDFRSP